MKKGQGLLKTRLHESSLAAGVICGDKNKCSGCEISSSLLLLVYLLSTYAQTNATAFDPLSKPIGKIRWMFGLVNWLTGRIESLRAPPKELEEG